MQTRRHGWVQSQRLVDDGVEVRQFGYRTDTHFSALLAVKGRVDFLLEDRKAFGVNSNLEKEAG